MHKNTPDVLGAIRRQTHELSDIKKEIESMQHERIMKLRDELIAQIQLVNGVKLIRYEGALTADQCKSVAFQIRNIENTNLVFIGGCVHDGKPSLTVLLTDDLVAKGMNAVQMIRDAAKEIQGGGGGQAFFASAGGKNPARIKSALDKLVETPFV